MRVLEEAGIPSIVRAGPDLFSQPEVLFFIGAIGITADIDQFWGSSIGNKSLPKRIEAVLECAPEPEAVLRAAARQLRKSTLSVIALLIDALGTFENHVAVVTQKVWVGFGQLIWQMNRFTFERNKILLQRWLWEIISQVPAQNDSQLFVECNKPVVKCGVVQR